MNEKTELTAADLAMYMGCEVYAETPTSYGAVHVRKGRFVGIRPTEKRRINPILVDVETESGGVIDMYFFPAQLKPILRPLSDMTDDELLEFAKICSGADSFRIGKAVANNYKLVICIFGEGFGKSVENLMVSERGETWYTSYFNDDENGGRNVINQHQQTIWLLSRHFDIFGWISAGLALDKTKL